LKCSKEEEVVVVVVVVGVLMKRGLVGGKERERERERTRGVFIWFPFCVG